MLKLFDKKYLLGIEVPYILLYPSVFGPFIFYIGVP